MEIQLFKTIYPYVEEEHRHEFVVAYCNKRQLIMKSLLIMNGISIASNKEKVVVYKNGKSIKTIYFDKYGRVMHINFTEIMSNLMDNMALSR